MERFFRITIVVLVLAILSFSFIRGVFTNENEAIRALEIQGYSNITILDKDFFFVGVRGCSSHDAAKYTAKVTNPLNKEVEVFVCVGFPFKGSTVRSE